MDVSTWIAVAVLLVIVVLYLMDVSLDRALGHPYTKATVNETPN